SILRVALSGCVEIELDPARQQGKGGPPHGQKVTGLPAWEDSSSSREEPAIPHCGVGSVPTVQIARRRGTPVPTARSRNYLRKQSLPYIRTVQHTVLFVLGLKGTMSEAELYIIRARLEGGIRNKAARGELRRGLPVGFVWG